MLKLSFNVIIFLLFLPLSLEAQDTFSVVTEEFPPYNYTEEGIIIGASTAIVKEVLKRAEIQYNLNSYPWARAYKIAQSAPNTFIYSINRTKKREKMFKWIDVIASYNVYLVKMKKRKDLVVENFSDFRKYKIGVVRDTARMQYLEDKGLTKNKELKVVNRDQLNVRKLVAGKIDFFPIDEIVFGSILKKGGFNPADFEKYFLLDDLSSDLYLAASLETEDGVIARSKLMLKEMKKDGTFKKLRAEYIQ